MYVVTNRIDIPTERAEAFEERFIGNMRNNLPKVTGLARATLDRPVEAGTPYKVTMEFEAEKDFEAWKTSEAFRASHARPMATEPPTTEASADTVDTRSSTGIEYHVRVETYTAPNA